MIQRLCDCKARVASIDLPSGLDADSTRVAGVTVRA
jgi:NAD(P)H-hydrate repair Nnr-like enzyme with NAD(P)H-hydrate epimerase domain